jgi:propanol-preferring alcohol dehydrogenase
MPTATKCYAAPAADKLLYLETIQRRDPGKKDVVIEILYCGVCHSDIHTARNEWGGTQYPCVPGHEIVGRVAKIGAGVTGFAIGERVGVPWLGHTCGACPYCASGHENLCDDPLFTGYTRDGGFATHAIADASYCFPLPREGDAATLAPLLCAGLIGWRSLKMTGEARNVGVYGFGAAAHIIAQVAIARGRRIFAFVRPGGRAARDFALSLGAVWAGGSDEAPPEKLDAAIIFAPVGALVPRALSAVRKGGIVVCGGIHMSDIPSFPYSLLWRERKLVSVANLTRADGEAFMKIAGEMKLEVTTKNYPLGEANRALDDLRHGRFSGAAVLLP